MKKSIFTVLSLLLCLVMTMGIFTACTEDGKKEEQEDIFAVEYNGETVKLGDEADKVLSKLGEPRSKQNTGNCGGLGETTRYDYSAFWLVVVDYEGKDSIIDTIELKNDAAETSKGIYIGSSESDVKEAYGEADETQGRALMYKSGDKQLAIGITDGKVSSITMRCVSE